MNPVKVKELEALITAWAIENKVLSAGDTMEVKVNIVNRPLVTVETKQEHPLDKTPVSQLELSVRATHCLDHAGIETVGQLRVMQREHILKYRNFGRKSLREIQEKLGHLGILVDWIDQKKSSSPVS